MHTRLRVGVAVECRCMTEVDYLAKDRFLGSMSSDYASPNGKTTLIVADINGNGKMVQRNIEVSVVIKNESMAAVLPLHITVPWSILNAQSAVSYVECPCPFRS